MNEPKLEIDKYGNKYWYLDDGKYHRKDGPAVEWANGDKEWYLNGKLHRENGPALEWSNGDKSWFINGEIHREDGPAVIYIDGTQEWHLNGKLHRVDGPAVIYSDEKGWYLKGKEYSQGEWFNLLTSEQQYNYLWSLDE
jgi:hypothetical protein